MTFTVKINEREYNFGSLKSAANFSAFWKVNHVTVNNDPLI